MYREVALVLSEHLDRVKAEYAKAAFTDVHAIPYREFHLLSLYSNTLAKCVHAREAIVAQGIALNSVCMDDDTRTNSIARWHQVARFNHLGELTQHYQPPTDELSQTTLSLLLTHLWPDGAKGRLAELRAHCISQHQEWDNQAQYGRLYTMMQLLEAN